MPMEQLSINVSLMEQFRIKMIITEDLFMEATPFMQCQLKVRFQ